MIFFLTLTVRGPFHRKDFKWKKRRYGVSFWKNGSLYIELNERAETATGSYSGTGDSLQHIYSVPVSKNHRNIRSRCLVHEFSFTDIFNDINHGYRAAILKKNLCGCFHFIWLWLLISIMKRCAERCALQLHHTSLRDFKFFSKYLRQ